MVRSIQCDECGKVVPERTPFGWYEITKLSDQFVTYAPPPLVGTYCDVECLTAAAAKCRTRLIDPTAATRQERGT